MTRLSNSVTGVVVSVSDEKASRLGADWVPVEKPAPKRTNKKSDGESD
jgi:hypothetical protein